MAFINDIFFDTAIDPFFKRIIARIFLPFAVMCWIYSFSTLVYPSSTKKIVSIYSLICIPYETIFIILLIVNPDLIGTTVTVETFSIVLLIFNFFAILTTIITGILFAKKSMESDDKKAQWKGKFLLIAFISFTAGSILEAIFFFGPPEPAFVLIRILLISSVIEYYMGFFLPDRVAAWLIKEDE